MQQSKQQSKLHCIYKYIQVCTDSKIISKNSQSFIPEHELYESKTSVLYCYITVSETV